MGHFLHRAECRSWLYPWTCPECASAIFVYQCTCGSGVFIETNQPPWPQHNCADSIVKASMAGAGGWLKAGQDPATGKGKLLEGLKGFVAVGTGTPLKTPPAGDKPASVSTEVFGVKAMDPMPGEAESFIAVVRDFKKTTAKLDALYQGLGDLGRKMMGLPAPSMARQITVEKNDLDPVESYTAVLPSDLVEGVVVGQMVWIELEARHAADRSAWVTTSLSPLD